MTRTQVSDSGPMGPLVIFPTGWYEVCETELSQMGKNNGNSDLMCKKRVVCRIFNKYQNFMNLFKL